jgi:tetratricopeptide (TPR) repeat protein
MESKMICTVACFQRTCSTPNLSDFLNQNCKGGKMKKAGLVFLTLTFVVFGLGNLSKAEYSDNNENSLWQEIAALEESLRILPDDANTHFHLGNACYKLAGHLKDRGSWILQTNQKISDSDEADQLYDKAIQHWKDAVRIQPRHSGAHFNLGVSFFIKEKKVAAIYHMRRADQLFMENGDTRGLEKSKRTLADWYDRFGYKPEDFVAAK